MDAPMFRRWSIRNFKSFKNSSALEFAPITLLAGSNSSGKSSLIQSILLLKQTLKYAPPTRPLALNGPILKLGAFNDVKNNDTREHSVGIGWEVVTDWEGLRTTPCIPWARDGRE